MATGLSSRQHAVLRMLTAHTAIPFGAILERLRLQDLSVSRRTVERDLAALIDSGAVTATEGKPRGYSRGAHSAIGLNRPLDATEAVVLQLAESHLRALLPAHLEPVFGDLFQQARASLPLPDSGKPETPAQGKSPAAPPLARWAERVKVEPDWLPRLAPAVPAAVNEAVSRALLLGHQLKLRYRKRQPGTDKQTVVSPLGLVQRGAVTFLIVLQQEGRDPFTLALHRIAAAEVLPHAALTPRGFKLDDWLGHGGLQIRVQGNIELVLAVADLALTGLQEAPLAKGQAIEPMADGRHRLRVKLPHTLQLEWWILGMGDGVEVLAPADLRSAIAGRLRLATKRYRSRPA